MFDKSNFILNNHSNSHHSASHRKSHNKQQIAHHFSLIINNKKAIKRISQNEQLIIICRMNFAFRSVADHLLATTTSWQAAAAARKRRSKAKTNKTTNQLCKTSGKRF